MPKPSNALRQGKLVTALFIIIILLLGICFMIYDNSRLRYENISLKNDIIEKKNIECGVDYYAKDFELLSPSIAWMDVSQFLELQKIYSVSYSNLKQLLTPIITENVNGKYGLFMEDLTTGAWIGINEKERFYPASLLKVPTLVATLKKAEREELSLDKTVTLLEEDLDPRSGSLYLKGAGYNISIKDLLSVLVKESDNTALTTLNSRVLTTQEIVEARLAMGLPFPNATNTFVSPKEYITIFRALYFSTYLRRPFSQVALELMTDTKFNSQIPAGITNKSVKVSHKVGLYIEGGQFHDCGIVYLPNKPYLLCVMSMDSNMEEADRVISEASKTIYQYMVRTLEKQSY